MAADESELKDLAESIRALIADNRKFLEKVTDEDFEPEDREDAEEGTEEFEEL